MEPTVLEIPKNALVMMLGPAGSGKSTFAVKHFKPSEIVSSDQCRWMVSDDMMNQDCNHYAFILFHQWISCRLALGRRTVADATNVTKRARNTLREIANRFKVPVVLIYMATSEKETFRRNRERDRHVPEHVVEKHLSQMRQALSEIESEGYHAIYSVETDREYVIRSVENG